MTLSAEGISTCRCHFAATRIDAAGNTSQHMLMEPAKESLSFLEYQLKKEHASSCEAVPTNSGCSLWTMLCICEKSLQQFTASEESRRLTTASHPPAAAALCHLRHCPPLDLYPSLPRRPRLFLYHSPDLPKQKQVNFWIC